LRYRIGIHRGDVVLDRDDRLGDGVNVAARLEGIAPECGIAMTRAHLMVRDHDAALAAATEALKHAPNEPAMVVNHTMFLTAPVFRTWR